MDVRVQACQNCGSERTRNLLVREPEKQDQVFVQCVECEELVSRYALAENGYYHHGKGFESYMRSMKRAGSTASAQEMKDSFENIRAVTLDEFASVINDLNRKERDDRTRR
ncbi:MAG: hypothetical protein HQK87_00895 [Nitrospinae bacterium]|nr:hypothetical protein [Nitrospinota bacterium]